MKRPLIHLDLFSGIGGFALAAEMVWGQGGVRHIFCDNEPFSQAILKKHWPEAYIYGDIRTLTLDSYTNRDGLAGRHTEINAAEGRKQTLNDPARRAARLAPAFANSKSRRFEGRKISERQGKQKESARHIDRIDLLTGGFPCQPFSNAGKRKGAEDDRHLWPEMLRVIREFQPRWVIGENVSGLLTQDGGMVFGQVRSSLEDVGYEVQSFIIPAVAVNAPHRRDRVWIVAYRIGGQLRKQQGRGGRSRGEDQILSREFGEDAPNTSCESKRKQANKTNSFTGTRKARTESLNRSGTTGNSFQSRLEGRKQLRKGSREQSPPSTGWEQNWIEVATRLCPMDDGLPNGLARPRGWRNAALKGAGNAIVPQVAAEIMRGIKYADEMNI